MKPAVLVLTLFLAACGADAPPEAPARAQDGITLSGEARVGLQYRSK
jgi:hypothetical protein